MAQGLYRFDSPVSRQIQLNYLLYLPQGYDGKLKWPLILFLHGAGERGTSLEKVWTQGLPKRLYYGNDIPFIVVSPQCAPNETWENYRYDVMALLDFILANYPVLPDQVYITGLSMGGYGTWRFASWYPDRFAAAAPICGGLPWLVDVNDVAKKLIDVPIWTFHGAKDDVVPVEETRRIVRTLQSLRANVQYTEYPDLRHDSWTVTYNNPELYTWLVKQK